MNKHELARLLAEQRFAGGYRPRKLLSAANTKLAKAEQNIGLSLSPSKLSGYQVCASSSEQCVLHCINTSGMAAPDFHSKADACNPVWVGRNVKTLWLMRERQAFMHRLYKDIALNQEATIRLNVFSDWMWERQSLTVSESDAKRYGTKSGSFKNVFEVFPEVQFYDYTKHFARMFRERPKNYHLTFSLTEANADQARKVLASGFNVAAVLTVRQGYLFGFPIIDGDQNDLRHLDPPSSVVGLKPKGSLRNKESDFVHSPDVQWSAAEAA